jgi:hypothetical protein
MMGENRLIDTHKYWLTEMFLLFQPRLEVALIKVVKHSLIISYYGTYYNNQINEHIVYFSLKNWTPLRNMVLL